MARAAARAALPSARISAARASLVRRAGSCSRHHQIVAMDHLIAATIAQNGLDFDAALARDALGIRMPHRRPAHAQFRAPRHRARSPHRRVRTRPSIWRMPAGRRLLPSFSARTAPASMMSAPCRFHHACDPAFAGGGGCGAGMKTGGARAIADRGERMIGFAFGDHDVCARAGCDFCGDQFGRHAAAADAGNGFARHRLDLRA